MADRAGLESILNRAAEMRALVVGDLMLDEYRHGEIERTSPEAPVPVVRVAERSFALGGAGNVACNVLSLGARCELVGVVGADPEGARFVAEMAAVGLDDSAVIVSSSRPTTHKLRVVARAQQLVRLDREDHSALDPDVAQALRDAVVARLPNCDVVILEDYDKGVFREGLAARIIEEARAHGCIVVADPKSDLRRFRGADLVKPNLLEATHFVDVAGDDLDTRRSLLEKLREELGGGEVVITRGDQGMSALDEQGLFYDVPTVPLEVFDVQGAGDTSVAVLALCRAAGASLAEACIVANAAGSVAVEKVGTATVDDQELRARLPEVLAAAERSVGTESKAGTESTTESRERS